jgi:DNA processing protein
MNQDNIYWLGFSLISCIGPVRFSQLENYFKDMAFAWEASPGELMRAGLDEGAVRAINLQRPKINLESEQEKIQKLGIQFLTYRDALYPARLKEIHDRPAVLFIKGEIKPEDDWSLAVVGTRQPTIYGRQVAEEMAQSLARAKITVISGLARGIDAIAHQAALAAGGRTLAVLGGGVDNIYPVDNTDLARRISIQGAVLSEYPPGSRPRPENFPRRNRILAGLSLGTLVIEAGESSGALITAQLALEQNREVFAIPGSILSPASNGTNKLIQEGAKLVRRVEDILEELNLTAVAHQIEMKDVIPTTETEAQLLKWLGAEPKHIDEICRESKMPVHALSGTLAMMELKGLVKQVGSMSYSVVRDPQEKYIIIVD